MAKQPALSASARAILEAATAHDSHVATLPEHLPAAAQRSVMRSLLKAGLLEELTAEDEQTAWRTAEDGTPYLLRATEAGLRAVALPLQRPVANDAPIAPINDSALPLDNATHNAAPAPASTRTTLRSAADAVLSAWSDPTEGRPALGAALAKPGRHQPTGPRQPRTGTKRAAILALLRRREGATVAQVVDATGWARHTVHGFFAGLKKAGTQVEVLDRIRQVGPGKQGAAGSYTVYRVAAPTIG